jgi:hypothetical protein
LKKSCWQKRPKYSAAADPVRAAMIQRYQSGRIIVS